MIAFAGMVASANLSDAPHGKSWQIGDLEYADYVAELAGICSC